MICNLGNRVVNFIVYYLAALLVSCCASAPFVP